MDLLVVFCLQFANACILIHRDAAQHLLWDFIRAFESVLNMCVILLFKCELSTLFSFHWYRKYCNIPYNVGGTVHRATADCWSCAECRSPSSAETTIPVFLQVFWYSIVAVYLLFRLLYLRCVYCSYILLRILRFDQRLWTVLETGSLLKQRREVFTLDGGYSSFFFFDFL